VLIIAGKPQPRELELKEGACLIWGNEAYNAPALADGLADSPLEPVAVTGFRW